MSNIVTVSGYTQNGKSSNVRVAKNSSISTSTNGKFVKGMVKSSYNAVYDNSCEYDISNGKKCCEIRGGRLAWLVGGNDDSELTPYPVDGYFDIGIIGPNNANAGWDVRTDDTTRIRVNGKTYDQASTEPLAEKNPEVEGRTFLINGFTTNSDVTAIGNYVGINCSNLGVDEYFPVIPGFMDIYLPRPSNAYKLTVTNTDVVKMYKVPNLDILEEILAVMDNFSVVVLEEIFNDEDPTRRNQLLAIVNGYNPYPGQFTCPVNGGTYQSFLENLMPYLESMGVDIADHRILYINNIFLGDLPLLPVVNYTNYTNPEGVNVQPNFNGVGIQRYYSLGISTFDYLLKIVNTAGSIQTPEPLAIFFTAPLNATNIVQINNFRADNSTMFSNFNGRSFNVDTNGEAFFNMRVENVIAGSTATGRHVMISNLVYNPVLIV